MSLSSQIASFAASGATQRLGTYGLACTYEGHDFRCTAGTSRDAKTLRDGGFTMASDRAIRFLQSALPVAPVAQHAIQVAGRQYRIAEVRATTHPVPEWLLLLHAIG